MRVLAKRGYTPISVGDLLTYMQGNAVIMPHRPVVLTFDDGWKNVENAIPVLKQHGFRASFWIKTHKGIGDPYLGWDDIRTIASDPLFEVYSHTASHPWNPRDNLVTWLAGENAVRTEADVVEELAGSRADLEANLHRDCGILPG